MKHALELYREEFETGQKSDDVPRVLRKALPSIQGDIDVKPYGEPALNRPAPAIAAWDTPNGAQSSSIGAVYEVHAAQSNLRA